MAGHIRGACARMLLAAGIAAAAIAEVPSPAAGPVPPALFFQDLSAFSGGPVDFGSPTSDSQKASGAFVDVDGDGWDDLVTLTGPGEPCGYFLNRPDGAGGRAFVPAPPGNGLDDGPALERDGASITAGDVDGDGDEDLFLGTGYRVEGISGENLLLLNDGSGRFTDATAAAGLLDGDSTTCACVLFDMDLDGDLDLLTANSNMPGFGKPGDGRTRLFRNALRETGALAFVDETAARLPAPVSRAVWAVVAPDCDGDGDPDVVISRDYFEPTQLWRNDGAGFFADVSASVGAGAGDDGDPSTFGDDSPNAMGVCMGDVNNDGYLDLYISDIQTNPLYLGLPGGKFVEKGASAGVRAAWVTWGVLFADFDLDGWTDLHVAGGDTYGDARPQVRPFLYRNRGDGTFDEMFEGSGLRHDVPLHRESGTAASDFDGDGRTDLLVVRAEWEPASPYLYRNVTDTAGRAWVTVQVRGNGTTSNRSAVGARIRVFPRDAAGDLLPGLAQLREVESSTGRAGRSTLWPTFGLGPDAASADVEVTWPRAGPLAARVDRHRGLPVRGRVVLQDPPTPHPRLSPAWESALKGGTLSRIAVAGATGPEGPTEVRIEAGPPWAALVREGNGGWTLEALPPIADQVLAESVELSAIDGNRDNLASRQTMVLTVLSVPVVRSCTPLRGGRVLLLDGMNLPAKGGVVLVDGVEARRVRARRKGREADGDATRLRVRVPLPREVRAGTHGVVVVDPRTGYASDPATYDAPPPR